LALRELIAKKNRLWTRYIETRDSIIYKKYKSVRNKVRNETRKLRIEEQRQVATQCKDNPKIFWKFVNSKLKAHEHIGDLNTVDRDGNILMARTNLEKAEALGNFLRVYLSANLILLYLIYNPELVTRHLETL